MSTKRDEIRKLYKLSTMKKGFLANAKEAIRTSPDVAVRICPEKEMADILQSKTAVELQ